MKTRDLDKLSPEKLREMQELLEKNIQELSEKMQTMDTRKSLIIEVDDPDAPAFQTVGRTHRGVRIVKANRDAARKAARKAAVKYRALLDSAA